MGKWMSLAMAVARAGSLGDLLMLVRDKQIALRAADFFMNGSSTKRADRNIPHDWLAVAHDIDPAAGRAWFSLDDASFGACELLAIGIEIERGPIDARWPLEPEPKSEPVAPSPTSEPAKSKGGKKPLSIWEEIIHPHFDEEVKVKGPFPSLGSARDAAILLLEDRKKAVPHHRTIEKHITMHRPGWIKGGVRGA